MVALDLPPGSVVCGLSHSPHRVAPMVRDDGTRYGTIMAYKTAELAQGETVILHCRWLCHCALTTIAYGFAAQ